MIEMWSSGILNYFFLPFTEVTQTVFLVRIPIVELRFIFSWKLKKFSQLFWGEKKNEDKVKKSLAQEVRQKSDISEHRSKG